MNEKSSKTSVSQNDLRSSPFVSDLYCHLSQHSPPSTPSHHNHHNHRQHSVARLLKLKTKARIKQQLAEQEKLSQTLPQLHNSDSLNDTIGDENNLDLDDGADANNNRANIESSNSQHPISSSSFFLHDSQKSSTNMGRNKQRPSSASAERTGSVLDISGGGQNRRDEFSESVGGEKQKRQGENSAALRKESRLLSLSSSFLSSSNESNGPNGQQKLEDKLPTFEKSGFTGVNHPPARPESGMRRQIQMLNSKIPQRKSNFEFSSYSSCEGKIFFKKRGLIIESQA